MDLIGVRRRPSLVLESSLSKEQGMQNALKKFHYDITVESYFYFLRKILYDMIILLHELDLSICVPRKKNKYSIVTDVCIRLFIPNKLNLILAMKNSLI